MSETLPKPDAKAADAAQPEVLYEVSDHIATLTLNRPDRMNAISGPMLARLSDLLLKANADPDVRAIVLTGAGRAFCVGLDLVDATQGSGIGSQTDHVSVNLDLRNTPPTILFAMDKPTICALNGSAAGYGLDTALGCDIRIMGESAKLAVAFTKRGIVPESGGTWLLPRLLGWAKAAELIFTGRTLLAPESLSLGLVNEVVPDDQVQARARAMAAEIAANAPLVVQGVKDVLGRERAGVVADGLNYVAAWNAAMLPSKDLTEGITATFEKRAPNFTGD